MKSKSADKIKMPSIDELLGVSGEESATDIEISRIHSFANHPFKVLDDDKMDDLVESIKQNSQTFFRKHLSASGVSVSSSIRSAPKR